MGELEPGGASMRRRAPTAATWLGVSLSLVGASSALWSWWSWWPSLAAPAQIAILPLILVAAAAFPRDLTLGPYYRFDGRGSLGLGFFLAMLGLAIGAWRDFHDLNLDQTVIWLGGAAAVAGCLIAFLAARIDPKQMGDKLMVLLAGGAGAFWAAGVLAEANGHFGARSIIQTPVEVVHKEIWTGSRSGSSYKLLVRANRGTPIVRTTVRAPLYDRVYVGERLCFIGAIGLLNVRWWKLDVCRQVH